MLTAQPSHRFRIPSPDEIAPAWARWLSVSGLLFVVILNAWVSDDAYITFRVCHQWVSGNGPVFNTGERVQVYTNPLWMMLFTLVYAITRESFFTSIVLSGVMLVFAAWFLQTRILAKSWSGVLATLVLGVSLSFVEYSTSGLENLLNAMLWLTFLGIFLRREEGPRKLFLMGLVASLGLVSRMDTALLYFPAMVWMVARNGNWKRVGLLTLALMPFIAWEVFCVIYYGFPFPNTAYAKLNGGISQSEYWERGIAYFENALHRDPVTLAGITAGLLACLLPGQRKLLPFCIGIALYALYVARIGGDFMAGRFFHVPFFAGIVALFHAIRSNRWAWAVTGTLLLIGLLNVKNPWYNGWRERPAQSTLVDANGIADERGWYQDGATLTAVNDTMWALLNERLLDASDHCADSAKGVLFWDFLGYMGYGQGTCVNVVDRYALADPLLARLPASYEPAWRVGHLERVFPIGYRQTLNTRRNEIEDSKLRQYYAHLLKVTRDPIWAAGRWMSIWHLNMGHLDHLVDRDYYRSPSPWELTLEQVSTRHPYGEPYGSPGQIPMYDHRPINIVVGDQAPFARYEVSLRTFVHYQIKYMDSGKVLHEFMHQGHFDVDGLAIDTIEVPADLVGKFDAIRIEGLDGKEHRCLGHLIPLR